MVLTIFRLYLPPLDEELCIEVEEHILNLKTKLLGCLQYLMMILAKNVKKLRADLMGNILTTQPP